MLILSGEINSLPCAASIAKTHPLLAVQTFYFQSITSMQAIFLYSLCLAIFLHS